MRTVAILSLSLLLLAAAPPKSGVDDHYKALAAASSPKVDIDKHYKEGQRLFGEKNFALALAEFEKVDELAPNQPQVYSWIGACLNELGRHAEARQRLESAFELLRTAEKSASGPGHPAPIDLGYYTLLARILVNLGDYEQAVATLESFPLADDGSEASAKSRQAVEAAKNSIRAHLLTQGTACLDRSDLDCARTLLRQAQALQQTPTPSVWETVAREASSRAERAPSTTDEEKAAKAELQGKAVATSRLWVEEEASDHAKRALARALTATRHSEAYAEAVEILSSLWSAGGPERDPSIQLDLSVAHAALEQWEKSVGAASSYISLDPDDPLGQGYCLRSLARFQMGGCAEALEDGERCRNADGTPRALKHLDTCRERLVKAAKQEANQEAAREASLRRQCTHLYERGKWARSFLDGIEFDDLVDVIGDFKDGEARCAPYFAEAEKSAGGNGFSSPTPALCAAGVKTASLPMNLSIRTKEDIASLLDQTKEFLELCRGSLNSGQADEVLQGLHKVEEALERPR